MSVYSPPLPLSLAVFATIYTESKLRLLCVHVCRHCGMKSPSTSPWYPPSSISNLVSASTAPTLGSGSAKAAHLPSSLSLPGGGRMLGPILIPLSAGKQLTPPLSALWSEKQLLCRLPWAHLRLEKEPERTRSGLYSPGSLLMPRRCPLTHL